MNIMRTGWHILVLAGTAICFSASVLSQEDNGLVLSTDGGISITNAQESFSFDLGGRVMWDTDTFDGVLNPDNAGDRRFNTQLRRARLEMGGTVGENLEYVMSINFSGAQGGETEFHDLGLAYTGFENFEVFVGRSKEPFGLEELISSRSITTIERNYFTEATDADGQTNFGVRIDGMVGKLGWSTGLFNPNGNPRRADGSDRFAWTSRVFGAPILEDDRVLHLGFAYTDRNLDAPELQNGFKLDVAEAGGELDSTSLLIDDDKQYGFEALYIDGPLSLQGEYFSKDMSGALAGPSGTVDAFYIQAAWTLTGERRGYRASSGIADIVQPSGARAVELVAKYDSIQFDADDRPEEEASGLLLGINWYLGRSVKIGLNYIHVSSDGIAAPGADDDANVLSTRLQIAF